MRRHVAILSSFVFLAVLSAAAPHGARAADACSMLRVWAHSTDGKFEYSLCVNVILTGPGARSISGIRMTGSLGVDSVPLSTLNNGYSPLPAMGTAPLITFKGEGVTAEGGGPVTITYLKPDHTTSFVTMILEPRTGPWGAFEKSRSVTLADVLMSPPSKGLSIESVSLK